MIVSEVVTRAKAVPRVSAVHLERTMPALSRLVAGLVGLAAGARAVDNGLGLTPAMGFNSRSHPSLSLCPRN
jgi:hypothetical protein